MAAKLGQKKKGQKVKKPVQPVNDIEKDSNVVLTKTPEEVNVKREKAKAAEKKETGFFAFLRKFDPIALSCFIAILLAGVVVIGAYVNATYINPGWESPVAVDGDSVEVRYVGSYGGYYWEEGAVIFDTNVKDVNDDNVKYAKSLSYVNKTKFDLLKFEVGGDDVLMGFSDAVVGKLINWTANAKIAPADGYGVSEKFALSAFTIPMTGQMSLADFNTYTSSNLKASDLTVPKIVTMPLGLDAEVNLGPNDTVTYRYVDVEAGEKTAKIDSNTKYTISDVTSSGFKVTYKTEGAREFKAVGVVDGSEQVIYIDDFDDEDVFKWKVGAVDNKGMEEQKGETLYFWIEIVDINDYADA